MTLARVSRQIAIVAKLVPGVLSWLAARDELDVLDTMYM